MEKKIDSILEITKKYDLFLFDLWGVIHDGYKLYPYARQTLNNLRNENKNIVFISNAPKSKTRITEILEDLKIDSGLYDDVVTSGQVAIDYIQGNNLSSSKGLEFSENMSSILFMGSQDNYELFSYLSMTPINLGKAHINSPNIALYDKLDEVKKVNTILLAGFYSYEEAEDWNKYMKKYIHLFELTDYKPTLLCINPDHYVTRIDGTISACAGLLAAYYEEQGGNVVYIGKPDSYIYESALNSVKNLNIPKSRTLMVGDNLKTDIIGAKNINIDSLYIQGGVQKKEEILSGEFTYIMSILK